MNSKVRSYFANLPQSVLDELGSDGLASLSSSSLSSLQSINSLPPNVQQIVRDAFRNGVRWSFISLIPWAGLSFLLVLRLSLIGELPGSKLVAKTQETGKRADEEPNKESVGTEDEKARGLKGSESSKGELDLESAN